MGFARSSVYSIDRIIARSVVTLNMMVSLWIRGFSIIINEGGSGSAVTEIFRLNMNPEEFEM